MRAYEKTGDNIRYAMGLIYPDSDIDNILNGNLGKVIKYLDRIDEKFERMWMGW